MENLIFIHLRKISIYPVKDPFKMALMLKRLSHPTSSSRSSHIQKSYQDRVSFDYNNRLFYIYDLGRYNNSHIFHYGECMDLTSIEFKIRRYLPVYKRIEYIPMGHIVAGKESFDEYIHRKNIKTKLMFNCGDVETWDVFTIDNNTTLQDVIAYVHTVFKRSSVL
jgi:hypothetical protein